MPTEFSFDTLEAPAPAAPRPEPGVVLDPVVGILARAEAEAEMIREAARAEGYDAGRAEALAAKVLAGALEVEPERVVESVRGALRGIVERERVTVLVHTADLELVREAMDELRATLGGIEHCEVQAERRVARGGAIVRTQDGDVDARVETKLQRAREVVQNALGVESVGT